MTKAINRIEALLHDTMGLDVASVGSVSIERAVRACMTSALVQTIGEYWNLVRESQPALQTLVEAVVVPETWFSRDAHAFAELTRVAIDEWRPARPGAVRRLLCVPCSTGEEPYSAAMAMLEAGYTPERFAIDAVDISERSLEQARRGIYGRNSFRSQDMALRDKYFEQVAEGHSVINSVRRGVRFMQGNVLTDGFPAQATYDAIFCRNLLIYFDSSDQNRTITRLSRLLTENGLLFVGPAESNMLADHDFMSAKVPFAFAFRKTSRRRPVPFLQGAPRAMMTAPARSIGDGRTAAAGPAPALAIELDLEAMRLPVLPAGALDLMDEALALANQGRLLDAGTLCEEQMRQHGPSAALFHLMGLISSARGELSAADRFYRKALYLDQNHQESLTHLSLLLEQQGDERGARLLRARAQRR